MTPLISKVIPFNLDTEISALQFTFLKFPGWGGRRERDRDREREGEREREREVKERECESKSKVRCRKRGTRKIGNMNHVPGLNNKSDFTQSHF